MSSLFEASSIGSNFLGAYIETILDTPEGAVANIRLDFTTSSTTLQNSEIEKAFSDGLNDNMFLGMDSQVVSFNVVATGTNKCEVYYILCNLIRWLACVLNTLYYCNYSRVNLNKSYYP